MWKRIALQAVAVVVGTIAGMLVMTGLHMLSAVVYPPPPGLDLGSQAPEQRALMKEWIGTLPAGAFVLATLAHGLGCMAGAVVATLIDRRRSMAVAFVVGVLFTVAGIMNLRDIPHPDWFGWVDLPVYLTLALAAGWLLTRRARAGIA